MAEAKILLPPVKPVLILSGHSIMESMLPRLSEKYDLCYLAPQAIHIAEAHGIKAMAMNSFIDSKVQEHALNAAALMTANVVKHVPIAAERIQDIVGNDNSTLPTELNVVSDWWAGFIMHHLRERAFLIAGLNNLSTQREIAGCIVHEDLTPDMRATVLWCNAMNIPTIHLPHANCHLLSDAGLDIHRETRTQYIAAAGRYMADWYAASGFAPDRIRITGTPGFDALCQDRLNQDESRQVLGIDKDATVVAYNTTWQQTTGLRGRWQEELEQGLNAVIDLVKEWHAYLIIKVHWNETQQAEEAYAQRLRAVGIEGAVTRHHHVYVLRAADVLIAQGPSNVCVDAAILGTPSAYQQTEGFDFAHKMPFRGTPDTIAQAALMAKDSRGDPAWSDFCKLYNDAYPDGNASDRVCEMIEELCQ